jgi:U3 small nucleolar ribonucleoprotein component
MAELPETTVDSSPPNSSISDAPQSVPAAGAKAPPEMTGEENYDDADAMFKELNRSPFFMTSLPEDDGEENILVEALKSMAYEGTRDQIAENFKNQGNEAVAEKRWFYSKAIAALKGPKVPSHLEEGNPMLKVVELEDDETIEKKERALEESCLSNRALCQLEMSTYPSNS